MLVDCGLVVRRDSPNGKRYARKGFDGAIDIVAAIPRTASRLELEPIAVELAALAQEVRKALESHVKTEETSPMGLIPCATYRIQIHTLMNLIPASKKAKGRPLR